MNALIGRSDFDRLRHSGVTGRCQQISVVLSCQPGDAQVRAGFAIPRAVGNAVQRNRCRRRLRHILQTDAAIERGVLLVRVHETFEDVSRNDLAEILASATKRAMAKL